MMNKNKFKKIILGGMLAVLLAVNFGGQVASAKTDPPIGGIVEPKTVENSMLRATDPPIGG